MKYAKKMKLVPIDDCDIHQDTKHRKQYESLPSDTDFTTPRILSILDNEMSDILKRSDIADRQKWLLYNQTLQRYLTFLKNNRVQNPTQPQQSNVEPSDIERFNSFDSLTDPFPENNISDIIEIRDSLDSITQPHVRQFFESARQQKDKSMSIDDSQPSTNKSKKSNRSTNKRTKTPRRRCTKRNATTLMHYLPIKKKLINFETWEPTTAK